LRPTIVAETSQSKAHLAGAVSGFYFTTGLADVGTTFALSGSGAVSPLGSVTVKQGSFHSLGFIVTGQASGTMTLSNARGSVKIQLTGPLQPGFAALPKTFTYKVVETTRKFGKLLGATGHADLTLFPPKIPKLPPGVLTFIPVPTYSLVFHA
jgi:hypothetical protein